MNIPPNQSARLATLQQLRETTLPVFLNPVPTSDVLRHWFDAANIPRFKSNPTAKRGGGPVFYSVAHVERFFRARTLPAVGGAA
jgi:trehalose utilization protein